ncbi:hypothetical protein [Fulvivirga ligni]|uniref:hypothetical protein n=1 Tax=Fulvivirga ligni TaxID=2904246 RepID=UPI001F2FEF4E|nr:hypothetical protein [Fulvivirga ligni]UII23375.1 hypothetical protein LVD16_09065 [Fulvivirga ligni]
MKRFLTVAFCFIGVTAFSCGWYPTDDLYFFYNLFNQQNISSKAYYPFLREDANTFYQTEWGQEFHEGNVQLWQQLLPGWKEANVRKALHADTDEFNKLWINHQSDLEQQVKEYMLFARKCSQTFAYRKRESWDYQEILKENTSDTEVLTDEGSQLFAKAENSQLKLRYAYQLIRAYHYSSRYQEAVDFYNAQIAGKYDKNEIFYYLQDQLAGCYYSLGDFEKAAYLFLEVFNNSLDRKTSAYLSYRFCVNKGADGRSLFTSTADEAGFITINSVSGVKDNFQALEELYQVSPNDKQVELVFMRALNNLERQIWPTRVGVKSETLPTIGEERGKLNQLYDFADKMAGDKKIDNKSFWLMASSYLAFCKNDMSLANSLLDKVKGSDFSDQKSILTKVYTVFSWQEMNAKHEEYLSGFLSDIITAEGIDDWQNMEPSWKYLIMDQVAHLYYKEDKLAKSFLMHNKVQHIIRVSSLPVINDLIAFTSKADKNSFEKLLAKRTEGIEGGYAAVDYLKYIKGMFYLRNGQSTDAYKWLKDSPLNNGGNSISELVSSKIFSNNITECFSCSDAIMEDSVFLASPYAFIKSTFNKAELADYLIQLEDMAANNSAQWKRKLANYLLGNYYFNVSNTGYYRGVLIGGSNCCDYEFILRSYDDKVRASEIINKKKGYNLLDLDGHYDTYYGLSKKSYMHYENVLAQSTDKELNARCLYMMAKCELNVMYNEYEMPGFGGYNGDITADILKYKKSFERLKKEYSDAQFYQDIIEECSFFRYYTSNY